MNTNERRYRQIPRMTRAEIEQALDSNNNEAIAEAILSAALHDPDWRWTQGACLRLFSNPDANVRRAAIVGIGHLARIHRTLDWDLVLPKLATLKNDDAVRGTVEDTLDDIRVFWDRKSAI